MIGHIELHQSSPLFNAMLWQTFSFFSREYMTYKSYLSLNVGSKWSYSKSGCISLDFGFVV